MIETFTSMFGTSGMNSLIKTGGAVLTVLLVVPALFKLLMVTIDEGEAAIRTRNGRPIIRGHVSRWRPQTRSSDTQGADMSKRGRKKRDRKKSGANHGKRPNS